MTSIEAPDARMFLSRLRNHYVDQLLVFIADQRRNFPQGAAEVQIQISSDTNFFRKLYCADFMRDEGQPEIVEFEPERLLSFSPITASLGNAELSFEQLRWDDVLIHHNATGDPALLLDGWFEKWFDPDNRRYVAGADLGNVIHSLGIEPQKLVVDFGSAGPESFWELLNLLENGGANELRISGPGVEAETA